MEIVLENLSKTIGDYTVIDHMSLVMRSGKVYGLCGYNGCGKTMLMRLIAGLIRPAEGTVAFDGKVLGKDMDFPPDMGILIENPAFLGGCSAYANLKLISSIRNVIGKQEILDVLKRVGLESAGEKKYRKYSLGMKQRLGIAAAVMERPALIILDEPMNALDAQGVAQAKRIIQEERDRGALIIMTCHDKAILEELCDVIIHIDAGKIAAQEDKANEA